MPNRVFMHVQTSAPPHGGSNRPQPSVSTPHWRNAQLGVQHAPPKHT